MISHSPEETQTIGEKIGKLLKGGEKILLYGEMGIGKTCLTQGIIRGAGVSYEKYPPSPTYSIINKYHGRFPISHLDLYRLNSIEEIYEIGIEELIDGKETLVIEWPDRLNILNIQKSINIKMNIHKKSYRKILILGQEIEGSVNYKF